MIVLATVLAACGAVGRWAFYGSARAYGRMLGNRDRRRAE